MEKKYKRKTYYIKNSSQTSFILRFVIISIMGGVAAVTAFNLLSSRKIDSVLYSMRLPNVSGGGLLWNEMLFTNVFVIIFIVIVFAITARGLYVRLHGPLKKMTSDINKAASGDLSFPIFLREKDEFKDFAEELNEMVGALNKKFLAIKQAAEKLSDCSESFQDETLSTQQLAEVKNSIRELENTLGSFKI